MNNCFILNNIRSVYNVGSFFRIADALGWDLIFQGYTPHPRVKNDTRLPYIIRKDEDQIKKTAVKTFSKIRWNYFNTTLEVLEFLKSHNYNLYSLEEGVNRAVNLFNFKQIKKPFALTLGNEVSGVEEDFLKKSIAVLNIPMCGTNNSLNVGVSAAVAAYNLHFSANGCVP